MICHGGVNLKDETININIEPRAKKVSLLKLAMVPVNIGGTLAKPMVIPDLGGAAIGVETGSVATDIAKGGVSSLGKLVGVYANKEMDDASGNIDDTDFCKLALAGQPLARAKGKPPPAALSSTSHPPPTQPRKPSSGDSTIDKLNRKLDEIDKGLGDALKGLFGK